MLLDKAATGNISINVLKSNNFCFQIKGFNKKIPCTLKLSDVTPVYRKLLQLDKANNRVDMILPFSIKNLRKSSYIWPPLWIHLYEYNFPQHFITFLNKFLRGFRKATHHSLFALLQQWILVKIEGFFGYYISGFI